MAPDYGLKYLPRNIAFGKMQAMVAGTQLVRLALARESVQEISHGKNMARMRQFGLRLLHEVNT